MVVNDLTGSGRNHEEAGAVGYVVPDQPPSVMRAPDQRPPSGGVRPRPLGWVIFALALGGFGIGTTEFVSMGLLPTIAGALGVTEPTAGHLVSMYALGVVVGAPVIAALTARMPRRTLLIVLMAAFTLGNLTTVLAPSYPRCCWRPASSPDCRTGRTSGWPRSWRPTSPGRATGPRRWA